LLFYETFLKPSDGKWLCTGHIKIVGRNHILPLLGIENNARQIQNNASLLKGICCVKRFDWRMYSVKWLIATMFNEIMDVLIVSLRQRLTS
jgi:hypothetical protein